MPMSVVMTWHVGATTPGTQGAQALAPVDKLYVATAHTLHTEDEVLPAKVPYAPAPHLVHAEVPEVRSTNEPAAHAVQAADVLAEATLLYLPATQAVHAEVPLVSAL